MIRDIATVFSRKVFEDILYFKDYSRLDRLVSEYSCLDGTTYMDIIDRAYRIISQSYRNEYVYKSELLAWILGNQRNIAVFSEFRVGKSIADMVSFGDESIAYEIKSEHDSPKRLGKQLSDYKRIFDKRFIVVPEGRTDAYCRFVEPSVGILAVGQGNITKVRNARRTTVSLSGYAPCLRMGELKEMALSLGASLDGVTGYDLFTFCDNIIRKSDSNEARRLIVQIIKRRKNNTGILMSYPRSVRQILLSLKLQKRKADKLLYLLYASLANKGR